MASGGAYDEAEVVHPTVQHPPDVRFQTDLIPLLDPLYRHALRLTGQHVDAEDLLQDAVTSAYAKFASFKEGTNFRAWIFRIMTNRYISGYRKNRRHAPPVSMSRIDETQLAVAARRSFEQLSTPEERVLNTLGDNDIRAAMCALPEEFRLTVYYADVEGLACKEIAHLMQTPVGTVTSRLFRARNRLRSMLTH